MMPGASGSANVAQRAEFETRCRTLADDTEALSEATIGTGNYRAVGSGAGATVEELAAMFPSLDPDLVRMLAADSPTPQHAMETMLALVASETEPCGPPVPAKDLPIADLGAFPSLTDSDGWQVVTQTQLEKDHDADLGSAWRDRAKDIAAKPGPRSANTSAASAWGPKRRGAKDDEKDEAEAPLPETDYEARQRRGQKKALNRAQFGRGGGKGAGRGYLKKDDSDIDESEDEGEGDGEEV